VKESGKREAIKTWSRRSMVTPEFVGFNNCCCITAKSSSLSFITENMVRP